MKVAGCTTFHTLYSNIYIYIFKCFLTFSCKISEIHKETRHSERKLRKPLCISVKMNENKSFHSIYADISCVLLCICGNLPIRQR